jgi:hypothetical protein
MPVAEQEAEGESTGEGDVVSERGEGRDSDSERTNCSEKNIAKNYSSFKSHFSKSKVNTEKKSWF